MKKAGLHITITLLCIVLQSKFCSKLFAQLKVGNNPATINSNAVLEIESTNKGLLLPRLALTSTTSPSPLSSFVQGMLVYDTATAGDVTPGMYYSDGAKWVRLGSGGSNWGLTGNGGTNPAINFLGTTDYNDLVFKTNAAERMRITKNGWVGIGTSNPLAALHIKGQLVIDSLQSGNIATDSLLVADAAGRIKAVSTGSFVSGVQKNVEVVAVTGQTVFTTPATITDPNKILLYRNGVLIAFTVSGPNTIVAEIASVSGDTIRIVQLM